MNISDFISAHSAELFALLSAIVGSAATWYAVKRKATRDDKVADKKIERSEFDSLIDANKSFANDNMRFREEVRRELATAKQDLADAKIELQTANSRINVLEREVLEKQRHINELTLLVAKLQDRLSELQ